MTEQKSQTFVEGAQKVIEAIGKHASETIAQKAENLLSVLVSLSFSLKFVYVYFSAPLATKSAKLTAVAASTRAEVGTFWLPCGVA